MENAQFASIFSEIADLLELKGGNEFRIRSYRAAARTIRGLSDRLEDLVDQGEDLTKLSNIGQGTAEKIHEIYDKGTCKRLEDLKKDIPEELTELMEVPQLGARKAMHLHEELGIDTLSDLKKACKQHKVRELEGMGEKTEQNILQGIEMLSQTSGRHLLKAADEHVESLGRHLDKIDILKQWQIAGSYRRRKETIGDLDVLIEANDRSKATDAILEFDNLSEVISKGKERVSVRLRGGLQIDFRFFDAEAFGSAMMYFTGSKAHNIALRKRAQQHDWKLNEYGLSKGKKLLAGKTEDSVYHRLNLPWIPPELREDRGELAAADEDALPNLVVEDDIRGDLHAHTDATDGENTIKEMADAAQDRGYKYLAITDHSKAVSVTNGLNEKRLAKHVEAIRKANDSLNDFWLLAGIEVDILKSGKLDLDEDALADLDWVNASIHSYFKLDEKKMTERLLAAIKSGVVHCISHPTGRMIGQREPIPFDADKVFDACREHDVCLEINAQPKRLDLLDTYCQQARDAGVAFAIGTDAHKQADLEFMRYGVGTARRGWLSKKDIVNTRTIRQLKKISKRDS